jgi:uncharacterized spore protein YtfJ
MDATALLEKAHDLFDARQVVGEPYEKNGTTVLPVASIRGGGGGGGGEPGDGRPGGAGGGLGLDAHPVGAYVISGDKVSWVPAVDVNRVIFGGQLVAVVALVVLRGIVRSRTRRAHYRMKHAGQGPK